jgi:hypothetical protein
MEELSGKLRATKGKLIINGQGYEYEEYRDPNRPHNFRTILINRHKEDSIIFEFDAEKDVLQKVAEKMLLNKSVKE